MKNKQKIVTFYLFFILAGVSLLGNFAEAQTTTSCESAGGTCEIDPGDPTGTGQNPCPEGKEKSSESCGDNWVCCKNTTGCCVNGSNCTNAKVASDCQSPATFESKKCSEIDACKSGGSTPISDATGGYVPMEEIPGFGRPGDWPSYILSVYQFGIWTIGISAMLMIMIGGYMYLISAGNAASAGKAKGVITDAITGLILALTAWLILHTINPDLVNLPGNLSASLSLGAGSISDGSVPGSSGNPDSHCSPMTTGLCSVENLKKYFGANAEKASGICHAESGGIENIPSGADKCQPGGQPVSFGLFQINISANDVADVKCVDKAASPVYTSKNHNCKPQSDYEKCKKAAQTGEKNIQEAVILSENGNKWGKWGANKTHCHF